MPEAKDGKEKQAEAYVFVRCGNKTAAFEELSDGSLQAEQQFVRKLGETDPAVLYVSCCKWYFFNKY